MTERELAEAGLAIQKYCTEHGMKCDGCVFNQFNYCPFDADTPNHWETKDLEIIANLK